MVHSKSHLSNAYFVLGTGHAKTFLVEYGDVNTLFTVCFFFKSWSMSCLFLSHNIFISISCIYWHVFFLPSSLDFKHFQDRRLVLSVCHLSKCLVDTRESVTLRGEHFFQACA